MSDQVTEETPEVEAEEVLPAETEETPDPKALGIELPDDGEEAISLLLTEVGRARNDATAYLDDLQRVAADFDNYRKRTLRDQAGLHDRAVEKVVLGLLPVLDTFDAAVANQPEDESSQQLFTGMLNTRDQLLKVLESEGLEPIESAGAHFNPEVHEPVGAPAGSGQLVVSQELRRGYLLNERVVRAALVVLELEEE